MTRNRYYRIFAIVLMTVRFFIEVWLFHRKYRGRSREETAIAWEALVASQARRYKQTALRLGGLLIKMGQFLSTRADIMPRAFTAELSDLTDRVPAIPWEVSRAVLEQELNQPLDHVFLELSAQPVASASIGEVYRGRLLNGTEVAVKVQRAGIEKIIDADFAATRVVVRLAKRFTDWAKTMDLDALYVELSRTISRELDFRKEYEHACRFAEMYEGNPAVEIPRYYEEWMTRRVLVMEWVEGAKVTDHAFLERHGINRSDVVARLVRLFLHQVLMEGFFHADLHPGNIFIRPNGTIVLLDFGMVGEIKREARAHIQTLIQAIVLKDYTLMVDALDRLHFLTAQADRTQVKAALQLGLEMYLNRAFDTLDDDMLEDIQRQIQDFVQVQPIQLPAEYAFLGRAFSTVVGVVSTIQPDVDFLEVGRPVVSEWLNQQETKRDSWKFITGLVRDVAREMGALPRQINRYVDVMTGAEQERLQLARLDRWLAHYRSRQQAGLALMIAGWGSTAACWLTGHSLAAYVSLGGGLLAFMWWWQAWRISGRLLKEHGAVPSLFETKR